MREMQNAGTITLRGKALLVNLDAWNRPGDLVIGAGDLPALMEERRPVKLWHVVRGGDVETVEQAGAVWVTKTGRGVAVRCDLLGGLTVYAAVGQVRGVLAGRRKAAGVGTPGLPSVTRKGECSRDDPMNAGLVRGFI